MTVSVALLVAPPALAEIVTFELEVTEPATTSNVAVVAPAGTVMLAGTIARVVLLLVSLTTVPCEVAAALSVIVATDVPRLATVVGASASDAG